MYTCADIVYGYDLSLDTRVGNNLNEKDIKKIAYKLEELRCKGFIKPYSGNSHPYAFGIIIDGFEAISNILISSLTLEVTEAQKSEFQQLINDLDDDIKHKIEQIGQPQLFILWSTS